MRDRCTGDRRLRKGIGAENQLCWRDVVLFEDEGIIQILWQICGRFSSDPEVQADLMQECLIHLWRTERAKPKQTRSWYLQSCRFHIQHWLAAGRSVDNLRRKNSESCIPVDGDGEHPALADYNTNGELFESVCFQDAVSTLDGHLGKRQKSVLRGLAAGRSLSEIAAQSRLSYPTVLKYRRMIAELTSKLGMADGRESARAETGKKKPARSCGKMRTAARPGPKTFTVISLPKADEFDTELLIA